MNRNRLLIAFISNVTNVVVHQILEKAIDKPEIARNYMNEVKNSWDIAKRYREKINPLNKTLPSEHASDIKNKIITKVRAELNSRIRKGYENIDLSLVETFVDASLKELGIIK